MLIGATAILAACGGGGGANGDITTSRSGFSGAAQKGPLIFGSQITVYELDSSLNETGRSFSAQTTDDLGNFVVRARLDTDIVKLVGVGYYMDELTGGLSSAPVTMTAIADLSVDATPVINVLTTLATPRVLALMQSGTSYSAALSQAQKEVLSVFGIDSSKINGLKALYTMSISGSDDQDAALLATSSVLSQMAANAATAGSSAAAQLSYLVSRISSDVANFGSLRNSSIQAALTTAQQQVNLQMIRTNVQTYYANRGVIMTAPKFEEWIDKDGSGRLPQRLVPVSEFSLSDQTVEAKVSVNSNTFAIGGLQENEIAQVSLKATSTNSNNSTGLSSNIRVVKNGAVIAGNYSSVQNGDTLGIQLTSDNISSTISTILTVGSNSRTWNVTSRTPQVVYSKVGNCSAPQTATNKYFALPFNLLQNSKINYVGVAVGAATAPNLVSIYSDNGGVPGAPLINSSAISDGGFISGQPYPQAQLSPTRDLSLSGGIQYWIVLKYNSNTTPYMNSSCVTLDGGYTRKMSSDGVNWIPWTGTSGNSEDASASNAPGFFLAD